MAFGLRSANDENLRSALIDSSFVYHFMPEPLPDDIAEQERRDFRTWIIGNALRELDQYFALFLDQCHQIIEIVPFHGRRPDIAGIEKRRRSFENDTNSSKKLQKLITRLAAPENMIPIFESLSATRNALSHNQGIVAQRHCPAARALTICWLGLGIMADGRLLPTHHSGIQFSATTTLSIEVSERTRSINVGKPIELDPHDLSEICLTYTVQSDRIGSSLANFVKSSGIPEA